MSDVLIFAASDNNNLKLSKAVGEIAKSKGYSSEVIDLSTLGLPLYTNATAKENDTPKAVLDIIAKMAATKAMAIFTPEYNGGLPPVLTNFIAWISRSDDKNWRQSFNGKKFIIGTHSGSGGLHALMALRTQLSYLGGVVMGRQIHTHFKKELNPSSVEAIFDQINAL